MGPEGHLNISKEVIKAMQPALGSDYDFTTFYLGNWLTDISQFNAPLDFAQAMAPKLKQKQDENWYLPTGLVSEYAIPVFKDLFGDPPPKRSKLREFFKELMYFATCLHFKDYFQNEKYPVFKEIYDGKWTQYYPHEHLDRWPSDSSGASERGLAEYLESDIVYIAETLTNIQKSWRECCSLSDSSSVKKRLLLLAEFGHAIHAVEDYFAHSNFVENAQSVLKQPITNNVVWEKRFYFGEGDRQTKDYIFTGYFDSIDTQFSILHFYNDYSSKDIGQKVKLAMNLKAQVSFNKPRYSLLTESEKVEFWKDRQVREALREVIRVYIDKNIAHEPMKRDVNTSIDAVLAIDKELLDKHNLGPILILDGLVEQSKSSEGNTALKQRLGSHTLLSKDEGSKLNFNISINLAKRVGKYIGEIMAASVKESETYSCTGRDVKICKYGNTDWLLLLQHFLCNPRKTKGIKYAGHPAIYETYTMDYKTKPLDTLASIAESHVDIGGQKMKWETIADATFGTSEKKEINKILKKWGCQKVGYNYAFIGFENNNNEIVKIPNQRRVMREAVPARIVNPWYVDVINKGDLNAAHHCEYKTCTKDIYNDRALIKSKAALENYYNSEIPFEVAYFSLVSKDRHVEKESKEQAISLAQEHKYFATVFSAGAIGAVECLDGMINIYAYGFRQRVSRKRRRSELKKKASTIKSGSVKKGARPAIFKYDKSYEMFVIIVQGVVKKSRYRIRYLTFSDRLSSSPY